MAEYLCKNCKENNNGWCPKKKTNGLKKLGYVLPKDCSDYSGNDNADTFVTLSKDKDGEGRPHILINIDGKKAWLPSVILTDYIIGPSTGAITITIPGGE